MDELKQLKSVLRSLVVSSPVQITLATLLRDYRNMMGSNLPIQKYGYRDPLQFLKERCGDCFLFQGFGANTVLTPIVPECLKHIDDFVQKQNVSSKMKYKGKRRSVNESYVAPAPDLIVKTFDTNKSKDLMKPSVGEKLAPISHSNEPDTPTKKYTNKPESTPTTRLENRSNDKTPQRPLNRNSFLDGNNKYKPLSNIGENDKENGQKESVLPSKEAYKNFLRKRLPAYVSSQHLDRDDRSLKDSDSGKHTSGSEQHTLSSSSSGTRATHLEELKAELVRVVADCPGGVCCTDLMKLYRERYNRELNFSRFGFLSVSALACSLPVHVSRDVTGGVRLSCAPPPAPARPTPRALPRAPPAPARAPQPPDDEDALPWIDFDPDVFPPDCLSFSESIPSAGLAGVGRGTMLEVMVGEVYSPSHFWFYRLGEEYHIAMEDMMDKMTQYYSTGEGAKRTLAVGAVRVGHYCSSVYERDWHRSLIVSIVDSGTVKVRHIDYGTVDRVPVSGLKPLLRCWGSLPAQALRGRLAGARPAARGRRWPHAAATAFLRRVQDRRLVANVVHVDPEENIVEVFLIDTSTERDARVDLELICAGHADPCTDAHAHALAASYLYPRFGALESGATPNFADISAYLRDGIALEYVDDYSRHVPAALPASPPRAASPPVLDNRVPLSLILVKTPDPESEDDAEPDSLESDDERRADAIVEGVAELPDDEPESRPPTPVEPESRPPTPVEPESRPPTPVEPEPVTEAPKPEPKPECRAMPRVSPNPPRHVGSQMLGPFGPPPFAAPSMPTLPFFVFPPPAPMQPYPPYAHPAFPRPYPSMEAFLSPPQRCFQPQLPAPYCGPGYSPPYPPYYPSPCAHGSGLRLGPPVSMSPVTSSPIHKPESVTTPISRPSHLPTPVSKPLLLPTPVSKSLLPTPVSKSPHLPTSVSTSTPLLSSTPVSTQSVSVSKPPILATNVSKPLVSTAASPAVTASVAPTPVPRREPGPARITDQANQDASGARRVSTGHGEVSLTVSECEIFNLLSAVDSNAAHWYIVDAISRAMATRTTSARSAPLPAAGAGAGAGAEAGESRLNPEASEFRLPAPPAPRPTPPLRTPHTLRPPPGFGGDPR